MIPPLIALLSAARADISLCATDGIAPARALPWAGATDIPVDVRPAIVFGPSCSASADWTFTLLDTATGAEVPTTLGEGSADPAATWLVEVFPAAPLDDTTSYTLQLHGEGHDTEVLFTTGAGNTVVGLSGEPTIGVRSADWYPSTGALSVDADLDLLDDPDALSVVQVRDAADPARTFTYAPKTADAPRGSGSLRVFPSLAPETRPDELCLQARQIDGAGRPTDWSDPACVDVTQGALCAASPDATPALALTLAALALARRRAG